ncbi:histidine kinase [Cohnella sp. CFH 77786]|uniref:sensor histidine kinase n=1 Tax=Cohnella sp. CFH 77786 TaxID=2662265 RepID=UPI001C610D30|nr:sensor histidine kinase [Cohnella sp. CFH 77786]MBW5444465.1 histidine kinase [Cohnella sp. CFH 77786]
MATIAELCTSGTVLTFEETRYIEDLARCLQLIADVSQSDVFIDCPTADKSAALVVAQAHPATFPSLYRTSVVGQLAYARNEPAVLFSLVSGQPVVGSRGISQEQIAIQQNVVPIRSPAGKVIGVLIMEQDISEKVEQERNVERLLESNEQLSRTLLTVAMSEGSMQSLMHEGIILFDDKEIVTYTNPQARGMLEGIGQTGPAEGRALGELFSGRLEPGSFIRQGSVVSEEIRFGNTVLVLKAVSLYREQRAVGGLMLVHDISDLIEKEKQILIQSAVIKEIHHRVKNNLQTVSSLLRLQMRRTKHAEVAEVYRDSINRINSIAVIHEMLAHEGTDTIPFRDVAERIARNAISSTSKPDQSIRVRLNGSELDLPSDAATTLALAVNELIHNGVKHAFADRETGEITITFGCDGQLASLIVSDNGCGMEEAGACFVADTETGAPGRNRLGLRIVETLVTDNLGGAMTIRSDAAGTRVQIAFPFREKGHKEVDRP